MVNSGRLKKVVLLSASGKLSTLLLSRAQLPPGTEQLVCNTQQMPGTAFLSKYNVSIHLEEKPLS